MSWEIVYKIIRAVIFPFRFLYLVYYQWRVDRQRQAYLLAHAERLLPAENGLLQSVAGPGEINKKGDDSDIPSV